MTGSPSAGCHHPFPSPGNDQPGGTLARTVLWETSGGPHRQGRCTLVGRLGQVCLCVFLMCVYHL